MRAVLSVIAGMMVVAAVAVVFVRTESPLAPPPAPRAPADLLTHGKKLYSQFNEELIIRDFFDDRRDGFYLDVGCYHWRDLSTTYYLEKHLGWKGIGIDAQQAFALEWQINRPRARFFSYIVTDHSGTTEKLFLGDGISSTSEQHVIDLAKGLANIAAPQPQAVEVPTITLNELLDRQGVKKVDFVSMDIEGGEAAALAGFDIERFKPDLLCVEVAAKSEPAVTGYFDQHHYERLDKYLQYDPVNWYYRPKPH